MTRTEITLSDEESAAIRQIARQTSRKEEDVIHFAIGMLIGQESGASRLERLKAGRGLWRGRADLPDARKMRAAFDRY